MLLEFGTNLKNLRNKKELTQEQVAEVLNTTAQSVSRWETGATYPDIEMLPLIATFYGVTTDSLLGMDNEIIKKDIARYNKRHTQLYHKGDITAIHNLTREYFVKYPSDPTIMFNIAHDTYLKAEIFNDGRLYNEAIELAKRHITQTTDIPTRCSYYKLIVYCYWRMNDFEKAKEYGNMLPDMHDSSNVICALFQKGMGGVKFRQNNIFDFLHALQTNIHQLADADYTNEATPYEFDERIELLKKITAIYDIMYENGDFGFNHTRLYYVNRVIAACYANKKDVAETLRYLEKSKYHAISFDNLTGIITHTSLLFNHTTMNMAQLSYTMKMKWHMEQSSYIMKWNTAYELLVRLSQERYDFLRDDPQFIAITSELTKCAKEIK